MHPWHQVRSEFQDEMLYVCILAGQCWLLRLSHDNSLALGKFEKKNAYVIFKHIQVIDGWGIASEIALVWLLLDFTDN